MKVTMSMLVLVAGMVSFHHQSIAGRTLDSILTDPCGGANPVPGTAGQGGVGVRANTSEALTNIATSASEAEALARGLKLNYERTRIPSYLRSNLRSSHLDDFPYSRSNNSNMTVGLQGDYDDVSTILVFMEHVHNTSTDFIADMGNFEAALLTTLCRIQIAADSVGSALLFHITREVMALKYRNIRSAANMHQRDYIVFRDSEAYLQALSGFYGN